MDDTGGVLAVVAVVIIIGWMGANMRSCSLQPKVDLAEAAQARLDECEKTLPRTQTCVLTAKPKESKP